jgi:ATP-dependent Clp protease protease subunit
MKMDKEFKKFATKDHGVNANYYDKVITSMIPTAMTPNIIEERQMNAVAMDVFSRLMMDRIIFLGTPINDQVANIIQAQLLFLESTDSSKDIQIYINSPGGSVYAGLGIYDTMQFIKPDVSTICVGMAASMGSFLLATGAPGKRYALPNSEVMIHQPLGGTQGQASDIEIHAKRIIEMRDKLNKIYSDRTVQPIEVIQKDSDRDNFMDAYKAKEYGLIDKVMEKKPTK